MEVEEPKKVRQHSVAFSETRPQSPTSIISLSDNPLFAPYKTDDSVRDKCIEMFVTALTTENPESTVASFVKILISNT